MPQGADPAELLSMQRALRQRLLDRRTAISWPAARDLAAHLLLLVDDPGACWQLTAEWLRERFDVERVDGGYARPEEFVYHMAQAEARAPDVNVPSLEGLVLDNRDPAVVNIWNAPGAVVYAEIAQERLIRGTLRDRLLALGTESKIAVALRDGGRPFALLCIDHIEKPAAWQSHQYDLFQSVSREVLGPILWAARRFQGGDAPADSLLEALTPAEVKVARLAAAGLSYKEIARSLGRSFSTVDHQLRSIRRKLDVRSHGRLVRLLSERRREPSQ